MGFREYFLEQADFADSAYDSGFRINCRMGATAAIDALAAIWETDFPGDAKSLAQELGGKPPASIRMARFVRRFTEDPRCYVARPMASRGPYPLRTRWQEVG